MSRSMRTYYYAVAGAMGGLIAWRLSDLVGLSFTPYLYLNELAVGALIGLCIGLLIGITEGLVTLSLRRAARSALLAVPLGLLAGAIALPLSEAAFQVLGGEALARILGWALFGLLIGLAEGATGKTQSWKGALGGVLGGALGGALLVASQQRLDNPLLGKALGLVVLGACVGAFISVLLSRAWLEVTSGKLRGAEFLLDKYIRAGGPSAILGSDALKADIALPDPDIAPQHAMLVGAGTHLNLRDLSLNGTYVNRRKIEVAALADRQQIRMGNTELVYHERR
jgi:hypothetical protein